MQVSVCMGSMREAKFPVWVPAVGLRPGSQAEEPGWLVLSRVLTRGLSGLAAR